MVTAGFEWTDPRTDGRKWLGTVFADDGTLGARKIHHSLEIGEAGNRSREDFQKALLTKWPCGRPRILRMDEEGSHRERRVLPDVAPRDDRNQIGVAEVHVAMLKDTMTATALP